MDDKEYEHRKKIEKYINNRPSSMGDSRGLEQSLERFRSRHGRLPHQNELIKEYNDYTGRNSHTGPEDF